jgi:hypothetical protein
VAFEKERCTNRYGLKLLIDSCRDELEGLICPEDLHGGVSAARFGTLAVAAVVAAAAGYYRPIISHAPQTRKRCIACPPSLKPTAAL